MMNPKRNKMRKKIIKIQIKELREKMTFLELEKINKRIVIQKLILKRQKQKQALQE